MYIPPMQKVPSDPELGVKAPLIRRVKEGEIETCGGCSSSVHRKFFFWTDGCINPECSNFYGGKTKTPSDLPRWPFKQAL